MTENIQYYLVPGRLTDEQKEESLKAFWGQPTNPPVEASGVVGVIRLLGTPIQPCADVETVGYGRETSFADLQERGCHAVSIHKAWDGGIPLIRRTDMEAQVARVAAEKDAVTGRLKEVLTLFTEYEKLMDSGEDVAGMMAYADLQKQVRAALNEGSTE